eukprot:s2110_g13.t1
MGGGSSETPAAAETVEDQTEGGTPGTPKLDERERSRSPAREVGTDSAPSGSAPSSATPATVPPAKAPPKRKAAGADDGAKANDEALRKATEQRLKEAAERRATEQHIKAAADRLPGHPEMEDDEDQPVMLPRALLHRLGDLAKALQHQGCLNERYMAQSHSDLERCAESLADLYQTIKVPSEMFAHVASLADGVTYYASEVKRMLSVNKEERSKWNWEWLQDPKAKKPMSAYVRELTNSAASTSAATLGIQSDMAECKGLLKSLLETMERAAIAAEKIPIVLLQQGTLPVSPVAPAAPETLAPPAHPDGTPMMGAPSPPDAVGTGGYEAYGAFPPQPPQHPQAKDARGNQLSSVSAGVHGGGEIPVPTNPPPEEIVVHWSGFAPMVAPNMNNDAVSNPPLTYELPGDVPNLKCDWNR